MSHNPTAPHDALCVYVCETDTTRVVKYPHKAGSKIPRTIDKDGVRFLLRSVHYDEVAA
jgi:hypothetical protein